VASSAYCSESNEQRRTHYEIYDREMLSLVRALEDWCHFLEGIEFEAIMLQLKCTR